MELGFFVSDWNKISAHEIDVTQLKLLLEGIEVKLQRLRCRDQAAPPN